MTPPRNVLWVLLSNSIETMKPVEASKCLKGNHPLKYLFVFYVIQKSAVINSLGISVLVHRLC